MHTLPTVLLPYTVPLEPPGSLSLWGSTFREEGGVYLGVEGVPGSVLVVGVSSGVSKALLPTTYYYASIPLHSPILVPYGCIPGIGDIGGKV